MQSTPLTTDLVLIGGGHSHLAVIKHFAMNPIAGLRITVISRDIHTPYSGMMPGMIAGHYQPDEIHIDLQRLCEWAGIRLFHSTVNDIDLEQQSIECSNRPAVRYDWLSINVGSQPDLSTIRGANNKETSGAGTGIGIGIGIGVKPIDRFLAYLPTLEQQLKDKREQQPTASHTISVVGGGAASVEVVLALQYHFESQGISSQQLSDFLQFELVCGPDVLLATHNANVRKHFLAIFEERNIHLITQSKVTQAEKSNTRTLLTLANGNSHTTDTVIWAINAGSSPWLKKTGLACNNKGFIDINQYLQSESHSNVFAAGDIAHFSTQPLPKSGVYAVRAGPKLAENLHRAIRQQPLKAYRPQRQFLSLLMTGDKQAIASRGTFSMAGRLMWHWKNRIDQRFVELYSPTTMPVAMTATMQTKSSDNTLTDIDSKTQAMRCGGCSAKVASNVLKRVMAKLSPITNDDISIGLDQPDDAAVINPPAGKQWLQTVDYFRAFIDDPYLLGRIATNHCLSDIYAMGGTPHSALAIATVPYGSETIVEDTLEQLMRGAVESLNQQNTALIGGHSSEGAELGFGLSVNGTLEKNSLLSKTNLQTGQKLILTKPLGSGTLFAANMQGKAKGHWIQSAIEQMLISNQQAAHIIHQHQATACTDITGFGLIGHLAEMLSNGDVDVQLNTKALPLLTGALECAENGLLSSLQPDNMRAKQHIANDQDFDQQTIYQLLFDPQTAGGLVAAVPAEIAEQCIQQLRQADCPFAAIIGETATRASVSKTDTNINITLV